MAKLDFIIKLPRSLRFFYLQRVIMVFGAGLWGVFLPIFIFETFGSRIQPVLFFYWIIFLGFGLFVIWAARVSSLIGWRTSMVIGAIFLAACYISLYFLSFNFYTFIILTFTFGILFRVFYWPAFHVFFSKMSEKGKRGRELGFLNIFQTLASAIAPLIAAWIIVQFGYSQLLLVSAIIYLLSCLPVMGFKKIPEKYEFNFRVSLKCLFHKKNRHFFWCFVSRGAESVLSMIVWPIFIFLVLKGDYIETGAIASLIIFAEVLIQFLMGGFSDRFSRGKIVKFASVFYAMGWIFKVFVKSAFQIFVVSVYHNFMAIIMMTPLQTMMYESAGQDEHMADEYVVLREVALNIGRAIILPIMLLMSYWLPINYLFVVGVFAALIIPKIREKKLYVDGYVK